jgi:hypothetical protein
MRGGNLEEADRDVFVGFVGFVGSSDSGLTGEV